MKKRLLLCGCAFFMASTLFAGNTLQVTVATGDADVPGTLPAQIAAAADGDVIEISDLITEDIVVPTEISYTGKMLTIEGNGKTIRVSEPHVSAYNLMSIINGGLNISNCTLKGGAKIAAKTAVWDNSGATIRIKGSADAPSTLIVNDVAFNKGYATCAGGVAIWDYTAAKITNSRFTEQKSYSTGGAAVYANAITITDITKKPLIEVDNCVFDNISGLSVGGALVSVKANVLVKNTTFTNIFASYGGALGADNGASILKIHNCYIANNKVDKCAGGVFNKSDIVGGFEMVNTTVIGNKIISPSSNWQDGAGISTQTGGNIINCTIVGNISENGYANIKGAGVWLQSKAANPTIHTKLINTIIAYNYHKTGETQIPDDLFLNKADVECSGSNNILGSAVTQTGTTGDKMTDNILYDGSASLFEDMQDGMPVAKDNGGKTWTVALTSGSIAAAAGVAGESVPTVDQRGYLRNAQPSIGAFEFNGTSGISGNTDVPENVQFYPNPASSTLSFVAPSIVKIYNNGSLVKDSYVAVDNMNISDLAPGFYIISINGVGAVLSVQR